MIKKSLGTPENLDQINNLNMGFIFPLIFARYLFQLTVLLKPESSSFALSWIDKVKTGI